MFRLAVVAVAREGQPFAVDPHDAMEDMPPAVAEQHDLPAPERLTGPAGCEHHDIAFVAQQRPHAGAFDAELHFAARGEHLLDLREKESVGKLHGYIPPPSNTVRYESRAAASSGRHSRW